MAQNRFLKKVFLSGPFDLVDLNFFQIKFLRLLLRLEVLSKVVFR